MKPFSKVYCLLLVACFLFAATNSGAQQTDTTTQTEKQPAKLLHAEPLYIDLIRDLGARKGEKEWNIGLGITDQTKHDSYTALVEYEFAPINRLGFEVELPFTFYMPLQGNKPHRDSLPQSRLNSLKLATQWSFLVSEKMKTSMAVGYIHEFELPAFSQYGKSAVLKGHVYNPFFIAAKQWGRGLHTLLYTGPVFLQHVHQPLRTNWQINSNVHYLIPGTRNFVGVELNKELHRADFDMTIRPQLRVSIADNLLVGIVTGIPIKRETERFSSFLRLIYEPKHKHI